MWHPCKCVCVCTVDHAPMNDYMCVYVPLFYFTVKPKFNHSYINVLYTVTVCFKCQFSL